MYLDSNPARASAKGLQSFVLSVTRMMARFSTLEQLRQTMPVQTVIRLIRVRKHLQNYVELWFYAVYGYGSVDRKVCRLDGLALPHNMY